MGKVAYLRPKGHDAICENLRAILDLPLDLRQETLDDLADALGRFSPPEQWLFVKINPENLRLVVKAIDNGPRPHYTLKVWTVAISHVLRDTGEIMAGTARLAEDAGISPAEVSRALARLTEIGALQKLRRGRYALNPNVGWSGSTYGREAAAKGAPKLRAADPVS